MVLPKIDTPEQQSRAMRREAMLYERDVLGWTYRKIAAAHGISHQRVTEFIGTLGPEGKERQRQKLVNQAKQYALEGLTRKEVEEATKGKRGRDVILTEYGKLPHAFSSGGKGVWWEWVKRLYINLDHMGVMSFLPELNRPLRLADGRPVWVYGSNAPHAGKLHRFSIRNKAISGHVALGLMHKGDAIFYIVPVEELPNSTSVYIDPESDKWREYRANYRQLLPKIERDKT